MLISQLLDEVRNREDVENTHRDEYVVEGLKLQLSYQHLYVSDFVRRSLAPINLNDQSDVKSKWQLIICCDPILVSQVTIELDHQNLKRHRLSIQSMDIQRYAINEGLDLCVRRSHGILWIVDRTQNTIHMITSGRTQYPLLSARNLARDLIVAHLHSNGWFTLHAGAARLNERNYLIIGDGGQGKTSLILSLMGGGAKFIANERILIKREFSTIRAISFPMSVAIALGSAQNFQSLDNLSSQSEQLLLPQLRLDAKKLKKVRRFDWKGLKDKILLLPDELCSALGTHLYVGETPIDGILVPELNEARQFDVSKLDEHRFSNLLRRNVIPPKKEKYYPDWMPLGLEPNPAYEIHEVFSALEKLPVSKIQFYDFTESNLPDQVKSLSNKLNAQ